GLGVRPHISTESLDGAACRAEELGGKVLVRGDVLVTCDPWGNELGLLGSPAGPSQARGRNRFCWLELCTPSPLEAAEYYEALFGWSFQIDPGQAWQHVHTEPSATTIGVGLRAGEPAPPTPYVYADDLAAVTATLQGIGGRIVDAVREIPHVAFGVTFLDPD